MFTILDDDALFYIFTQVDNYDIINIKKVSKQLNTITTKIFRPRLLEHVDLLYETFPHHILGALPEKVLWNIKRVQFQNDWIGSTDYIDNVKPRDLLYDFAWTNDRYNRLVILMRVKDKVLAFFQRYTQVKYLWAFGSSSLCLPHARLDTHMIEKMDKWIKTSDSRVFCEKRIEEQSSSFTTFFKSN